MRIGIGLVVAAALMASAHADDPGDDVRLIEGVFVPGRQPDGNSVLLRGPEGWVVVDSGRHAAHAARILDAVAESGAPIVAVVNTHWHLDHVSGNVALRAAHPDLTVYASDAIDDALEGFLARSHAQLTAMLAQPGEEASKQAMREEIARIELGPKLRPDEVISGDGERSPAGRTLHVGLARHAATGGDVWLYDPAQKLLIAGDLVTLPAPFLDTACAPRWQKTFDTLEATGFESLLPGHGKPMDRAQFATYRRAFDGLLKCAAEEVAPSVCSERWSADAGTLLDGQDPDLTRGLIEYYVTQRLRGADAMKDCPAADA